VNESWPSLLQSSINGETLDLSVINAGISGDTTSGGLYRLPKLLETYNPKLVILELGGNDGLRGMSIKKVIKKKPNNHDRDDS
jgi:acyl-CoA thioesterase-1